MNDSSTLYAVWLKQGRHAALATKINTERGYQLLKSRESVYARSMLQIIQIQTRVCEVWDTAPDALLSSPTEVTA
jgi:hypothetical protein